MATQSQLAAYQSQQVMGASPVKLVAMLYDRTIASLREAVIAIGEEDIQRRWTSNNRAVEIITHLWSTLDTDQGGEISENLSQLYRFMLTRLLDVDMKNDPAAAEEVIQLLEPLRKSWHELASSTGEVGDQATAHNVGAKPLPVSATDQDDSASLTGALSVSA